MRGFFFAAGGYVAAVVFCSWPLPRHVAHGLVGSGGPWGQADVELVSWILAWDAHALVTQPLALFQANIFYPARDTLAASEHLLGLAPVAAPAFLLTHNAVFTHNLTILTVVLVMALATWGAVRAWTGLGGPAFLAGAALAFSPLTTHQWNRLHETAVHFFPLVLALAWRAAAMPRAATLVALAAVVAFQALAGIYVSFELLVLLLVFAPVLWWEARRAGHSGLAPAAAVGVGMLALVPVTLPYARARAAGRLLDYAHFTLPESDAGAVGRLLLDGIGWPVLALAALGAGSAPQSVRRLRWGLIAVGAIGVWMALGRDVPGPFELAQRWVPGFSSVRAPSRFLVLPVLAACLLAGLGAAALAQRGRHARAVNAAAVLLGVGLIVARAPALRPTLVPDPLGLPAARAPYAWLAAHGAGRPVLELPVVNSALDYGNLLATGRYMLGSTLHWLPLINGYSGHPPPSDRLLMTLAQRLPDAEALAMLSDLAEPGWLVLHFAELGGEEPRWQQAAVRLGIVPAARFETTMVYRVVRSGGRLLPRLLAQLEDPNDDRTLGGVLRAPLPATARRGRVTGRLPKNFAAGLHGWYWVEVTNHGDRPWPGLSARASGVVALQMRWRDAGTGATRYEDPPVPLARDLRPGERLRAQVESWIPPPGEYAIEVGLVQEGSGWFADLPGGTGILRRRVRTRPLEALLASARQRAAGHRR
jgi:hypothetical protein